MKRHRMKYLKYFMLKTFFTAVVGWPSVKWDRFKMRASANTIFTYVNKKKIGKKSQNLWNRTVEHDNRKYWYISVGMWYYILSNLFPLFSINIVCNWKTIIINQFFHHKETWFLCCNILFINHNIYVNIYIFKVKQSVTIII